MEHLSVDVLNDMLAAAAKQVTVGGKYKHYKGDTFTVTGLGILESTTEVVVIYRADYDHNITFVRQLTIWQETVEVGGQRVPRFTPVASAAA